MLKEILGDVDTVIPDHLDQLTLWKIILNMVSEPPRRKKLANVNTLQDVVELIRNSKKIIILTGKKMILKLYRITLSPSMYFCPGFIQIWWNCPNRLNFFASTGHNLVNFKKKCQLPPFLVLKGFKTTEICKKILILEPQNYIRFFNLSAVDFEALKSKSYYIFQLFCSLLVPEKVVTDIFY